MMLTYYFQVSPNLQLLFSLVSSCYLDPVDSNGHTTVKLKRGVKYRVMHILSQSTQVSYTRHSIIQIHMICFMKTLLFQKVYQARPC